MNNTTKAKYDMAEKMLKVDISLEEVALMTELPMDSEGDRERDTERRSRHKTGCKGYRSRFWLSHINWHQIP
ncbi:MAG: hypothetical protein ACLTDF_12400 [Coprococcus sp.]